MRQHPGLAKRSRAEIRRVAHPVHHHVHGTAGAGRRGLVAAVESLGGQIRYNCTARGLVRDGGRVTGVEIRNEQGEFETVSAGEVIIATGGFEGNAEMLARYVGPVSRRVRPVARGGYYNKGEGVSMALAAGAAPAGDYTLFHAEPVDPRSGAPEAAIFAHPYGILVDQAGRRFVDEGSDVVDLTYEAIARLICGQESGQAFLILDSGHQRIPRIHSAIRTDVAPVTGDTIQELADQLGIEPGALAETVHEYNLACQPGTFDPLALDGLHTDGVNPPKSNWAVPLAEPPFFAYPIISSNVFTFGGVKVNCSAQVLDGDGIPIAGLSAAGEVIGLYYGRYAGSTSVLRGAVFGRLAGSHAAARLHDGRI
jgi:tricarballylate dehydrogenase